jgi:hypothetical protein
MLKLILALTCFLTFQTTHAQTFKIVKIAGKKAIVEVDDPRSISVNQSYNVGQSMMATSSGNYKRDHALGFNFSYTTQSSPSISRLNFDGFYLWNLKTYEVGPIVGLTSNSGGGVTNNTTTIGGIGYYNFNENRPGVETVLAAVGELAMTSGSGSSLTHIEAGGNYRWFLLSGDHCISASLLYELNQTSGNNTSGFALTGGIITYF